MTSYRLQKQAESLQSFAADGQLLAHGLADDEVTAAFVRVHSSELAIRTRNLAAEAESARWLPQTQESTPRLIRLAREVSAALEELNDGATDPAVGAEVEQKLGDLADEAESLGKSA